jgi:integrase
MVAGDPNAVDAKGKKKPRKPWSRQTVNRQIKRIQSLFRWGVSVELVNESTANALATLRILHESETTAAESKPRRSVPGDDVTKVRAKLKPLHQDILDLLMLTGARPGELVGLHIKDVDTSVNPWRSDLAKHKTRHRGKRRTLFFNTEAQAIMSRHMKSKHANDRILACRRDNFGTAVKRACVRAGVDPFVPHELRHTTATTLVDAVGLESAQRLLGHSDVAMTAHYSKKADAQAIKAAKTLKLPKQTKKGTLKNDTMRKPAAKKSRSKPPRKPTREAKKST